MYKFHGTFPTNISDIPLSYDSSDTIEEFTVELQVQWVDVQDSQSKNTNWHRIINSAIIVAKRLYNGKTFWI